SERHYFGPTTRKELSDNYFWHESAQADLDGDGLLDIVTTAAQVQRLQNPLGSIVCDEAQQPNQRCTEMKIEWYRNTGSSDLLGNPKFEICRIAAEHNIGGVFIKLHDIDGDGDQDIVLSQFFGPPAEPSLLWLENIVAPGSTPENCSGEWLVHEIDHSIGLGYHMEFADINNDGKLDLVAGSHNNQDDPRLINDDGSIILPGMYWFDIPNNPGGDEAWTKHIISQDLLVSLNYGSAPHSQGVPGIFNVGDINNDGLLDIALPGDGNDKLYAILQGENNSWQQHIVDTAKQFGMAMVADIDGDGRNEIIAAQHNSLDGETALNLPPGQLAIYQIK
ncbi:MAG: FG-GAP repeat domain-containing protein, partial [Spongiibacteraceae bacterium]